MLGELCSQPPSAKAYRISLGSSKATRSAVPPCIWFASPACPVRPTLLFTQLKPSHLAKPGHNAQMSRTREGPLCFASRPRCTLASRHYPQPQTYTHPPPGDSKPLRVDLEPLLSAQLSAGELECPRCSWHGRLVVCKVRNGHSFYFQ